MDPNFEWASVVCLNDPAIKIDGYVNVLTQMEKTKWNYSYESFSEKCVISRMMYNGTSEFVREFRKDIHGDKFQELARTFVAKNNGE